MIQWIILECNKMNAYKRELYRKHIRELERNSKRDPILIERTIYAFGLPEAIIRVLGYLKNNE